jgi:hypothetical protein
VYLPPADRQAPPSAWAVLPDTLFGTDEFMERSMLASPFFWLGGVASVLVWTGIALAVLRFA